MIESLKVLPLKSEKKMKITTIDLTPTWRAVLPVLLAGITEDRPPSVQAAARAELERMAKIADAYVLQHGETK